MPPTPAILDKPTVTDKFWVMVLVLFVFLTRVFFLNMGFGRGDAWRVGVTGKFWVEMGEYFPSRPPGFPLVEILSAISYSIFRGAPATWILTNLCTAIIFCVAVVGLWNLARKWGVKTPFLVTTIFAFAPLNWVYSIETIDYLWTTAFIVWSVLVLESENKYSPLWSGIFLGLATSARFFAAFLVIPLLILTWTRRKSKSDLFTFLIPFVAVSLGAYAIVFLQIDDWGKYKDWFNELNKVRSGLEEIEGGTFVRGFLQPAVRLFGPLASIGLIAAGLIGVPEFVRKIRDRDRGIVGSTLIAIFIITPYFWHMHQNYWIPATGFFLILLARTVNPKLLISVGVLIFAANFPWWQENIEALGLISKGSGNPRTAAISQEITNYQNVNVHDQMKHRQFVMSTVEDMVGRDIPSDYVIMPTIRLPMIQFMIPGIQRIDLELSDGAVISVWGSPESGPVYKYDLSPDDIGRLIESGYHVIWLPGLERSYYATYGVQIHEVEGVEMFTQ